MVGGEPRGVRKVSSLVSSLVMAIAIVGALATQSGGTTSAAQSCNQELVADLVRSFVRAYNAGDSEELDQIWAAEPDFEWYSVSNERIRADAYDRETLLPYFDRRHQLNDRLHLKRLHVGSKDDRGNFGIAYRLQRRSDQEAARGRYHGKASARDVMALPTLDDLSMSRCVLFVWSMGGRGP